jgi:hypothetical protein
MLVPNTAVNYAIANFIANQEAICAQYPDAYIILHDTQILGPYKTDVEAYRYAFSCYEIGTFIVKYCGDLQDEKEQ